MTPSADAKSVLASDVLNAALVVAFEPGDCVAGAEDEDSECVLDVLPRVKETTEEAGMVVVSTELAVVVVNVRLGAEEVGDRVVGEGETVETAELAIEEADAEADEDEAEPPLIVN